MCSVFNMGGRLAWASLSDYIGRKGTYFIFFGAGIPLYLSIPHIASMAEANPGTSLGLFLASTMLIFSAYGGGFATIPGAFPVSLLCGSSFEWSRLCFEWGLGCFGSAAAVVCVDFPGVLRAHWHGSIARVSYWCVLFAAYLADIFGTKFVGGIHGRLLTAWSLAGVLGPVLLTSLRQRSVDAAIRDIARQVDPVAFQEAFGAPREELQELMDAKAVTIGRLMDIAPSTVVDPTPYLYNSTMHAMAGLLSVAFVANALMRPVHPKHHM